MLKVLLLLMAMPVFATTLQLQTVEQQIAEADGIMMGHFLHKKSIRLENKSIATQMIFKINREYGLQSDQFGMDEVIVHYPGGSLDGEVSRVEGTPDFISGEKVVLFISNIDNRYWGLNLALGAFKQINYGKEILLVNALVPQDKRVGQIYLDDFELSVRNIKGSSLKNVTLQAPVHLPQDIMRAPASFQENNHRSVASDDEVVIDNEEMRPRISTLWLMVLLAFMGGVFRFQRQRRTK